MAKIWYVDIPKRTPPDEDGDWENVLIAHSLEEAELFLNKTWCIPKESSGIFIIEGEE